MKTKMKTLKEIIDTVQMSDDETRLSITYRTYAPDGEDILVGHCFWDSVQKNIVPTDGDGYSLDDQLINSECYFDAFSGKHYLVVWYGSKWQ